MTKRNDAMPQRPTMPTHRAPSPPLRPCSRCVSRAQPSRLSVAVAVLFGLAGLVGLGTTACGPAGSDGAAAGDGRPRVLATTNLVADAARRIGGDLVVVESLMGPGVDPHLYKASEGDVRRLAEADLVLYSGLHLEGKMVDVLEKMGRSRPVVAVTETMDPAELLAPEGYAYAYDPHVWFDVALWAETMPVVAEALGRVRPEERSTFESRARAYREELLALDRWVASEIERIPPERRVLVTAHDAFGYFGRAYGLEVVGIQGISTASEAGLQDVERVVDLVAGRKIPAIFVESSVPRRAIEAVQAAVRDRGHEVTIGGELYSDSLGAADGPAGDYPDMVRANVGTIAGALAGGVAPGAAPEASGTPPSEAFRTSPEPPEPSGTPASEMSGTFPEASGTEGVGTRAVGFEEEANDG